jgi:hypothetical protein
MSYAELSKLEVEIARLKAEKQSEERAALREKMAAMAREHGFDMGELFDKRRKGRHRRAQVSRSKNPRSTLGWPWSDATLDGHGHKKAARPRGRFLDLVNGLTIGPRSY